MGLDGSFEFLVKAGEGEARLFEERAFRVFDDLLESAEFAVLVAEFVEADEAAIEGLLTDFRCFGRVGGDLEPFRGGLPAFCIVVVRGEVKGGGFDEFTVGPAGGGGFEAFAAGVIFPDFAVTKAEEIPSIEGLLMLGEFAEKLVEFVRGEAIGLVGLFAVFIRAGGIVVDGGEIEEIARRDGEEDLRFEILGGRGLLR